MRRLLVILLVLAVGAAGLGYYRGWLTIATEQSPEATNITVGVDKEKVRADRERAQQELKKLADSVTDKGKTSPAGKGAAPGGEDSLP